MSWRPEGWDALDIYAGMESIETTATDLIEAGADAMLEALKASGKYNQCGYGVTDFPNARYGWRVFIPEEV